MILYEVVSRWFIHLVMLWIVFFFFFFLFFFSFFILLLVSYEFISSYGIF